MSPLVPGEAADRPRSLQAFFSVESQIRPSVWRSLGEKRQSSEPDNEGAGLCTTSEYAYLLSLGSQSDRCSRVDILHVPRLLNNVQYRIESSASYVRHGLDLTSSLCASSIHQRRRVARYLKTSLVQIVPQIYPSHVQPTPILSHRTCHESGANKEELSTEPQATSLGVLKPTSHTERVVAAVTPPTAPPKYTVKIAHLLAIPR